MWWLCWLLMVGSAARSETLSTLEFWKVANFENTFAIGEPQSKGEWEITPRVRVCTESGAPFFRVAQAIKYWEKNGYNFHSISADPSVVCREPSAGEIVIMLPDNTFDLDHMASTRIYTDKTTGAIVKAKIHILPRTSRKERVLEHEFGHALGWRHYNQRYHIMNAMWERGGYNAAGVRRQ